MGFSRTQITAEGHLGYWFQDEKQTQEEHWKGCHLFKTELCPDIKQNTEILTLPSYPYRALIQTGKLPRPEDYIPFERKFPATTNNAF